MPDKTHQNKMRFWAAVGLMTLFCLLTALFFNRCTIDHFVENNDNFGIAAVTSSLKYNNYCIFLSPLLCSLIRNTALLLPNADAFAAVNLIICTAAFAWCSFLIFKHTFALKRLIFITITVFYAAIAVCAQNFTVISAFLLFVGAAPISAMIGQAKTNKIYILISCVFFVFGFMYRRHTAILFLPYTALYFIAALTANRYRLKAFLKNAAAAVLPALLAVTAVQCVTLAVDNTDNIRSAVKFNSLRASVQDYPLLPYSEAKDKLPSDITENDYTLITHFMTPDTERMDAEFMQTFAKAAIDDSPNRAEVISQTLKKNKYSLKSALLFACIFAVSFFIIFYGKKRFAKLAAAICFFGIIAGCMFFLYLGRLPERIMLSIMTAGLCALCAMLYNTDIKNSKVGYSVFALLCFASILRFAMIDAGGSPDTIFTAKQYNADFEEPLKATYTGKSIFIWDTINYSLYPSMYFSINGKLPSDDFAMHNISAGGWTYGQVYQKQAFAEMGITNPAYDLVYRPDTYYAGELPVMEKYIKEHIRSDIRAEMIGYIFEVPVYRFTFEN